MTSGFKKDLLAQINLIYTDILYECFISQKQKTNKNIFSSFYFLVNNLIKEAFHSSRLLYFTKPDQNNQDQYKITYELLQQLKELALDSDYKKPSLNKRYPVHKLRKDPLYVDVKPQARVNLSKMKFDQQLDGYKKVTPSFLEMDRYEDETKNVYSTPSKPIISQEAQTKKIESVKNDLPIHLKTLNYQDK
ncbi:hypothetical protein pb186bvf_005683 [Paramecium bursaria]